MPSWQDTVFERKWVLQVANMDTISLLFQFQAKPAEAMSKHTVSSLLNSMTVTESVLFRSLSSDFTTTAFAYRSRLPESDNLPALYAYREAAVRSSAVFF